MYDQKEHLAEIPSVFRRADRRLPARARSGGADAFKAKTFASEDAITALFNRSAIPLICEALLGAPAGGGGFRQAAGQLALRFPGDLCSPSGACGV